MVGVGIKRSEDEGEKEQDGRLTRRNVKLVLDTRKQGATMEGGLKWLSNAHLLVPVLQI